MDLVTQTLGDDGVLLIALNRPDRRNAIDGEMTDALRAAFETRPPTDAAVRAVILTGEGKAFSAGGDLSRFERDWDPREFRHDSHRLTQLITLSNGWRSPPWPRSTASPPAPARSSRSCATCG